MTFLQRSCCIFLLSLVNLAYGADCETYSGLETPQKICFTSEFKAYVSSSCLKDPSCHALKILKNKKPIPLPRSVALSGNPAAAACEYFKYEVEVLTDADGNQMSFCRFQDESLIDTNALERITH
jgi:putative hemolysin